MNVISSLPPGLIMILGALLVPWFSRKWQPVVVLACSVVSLIQFGMVPSASQLSLAMFGLSLDVVRIDALSRIFGVVFHLAAIIAAIYALHVRDARQHASALVYAGAAIGAVCAGDLLTLFIYWELTALSSVFLIWASESDRAYRSGLRYLIIQVGSGVLLLSGVVVHFVETRSLEFGGFVEAGEPLSPSALLILLAFGIKAAFPMLHNWLQDAYPNGTPTGTVFLSAFTTKLAIYALIRGFAGYEPLIAIGCAMTLFPIVFAVIENDLRRVLSYSLNNQLGFMVVGIGIGTELAINGAVAHAFCHIIYKSLLFMSMGAVLYRAGTTKATELGGLHKSMPWTTGFCVIGAGSIAGFPLLSGFVSKSMIITAAAETHQAWIWIVLLIASAGVMEHSGIKIPFFAFFAHDNGRRVKEAPWNMLIAMGLASAMCVLLGVAYPLLYRALPFAADYRPFTVTHVITQLQLLMFAALAFVFLVKTRLYPREQRATVLDTDWIYRRLLPVTVNFAKTGVTAVDTLARRGAMAIVQYLIHAARTTFDERGILGRTWSSSTMTFWATVMLALSLVIYYL